MRLHTTSLLVLILAACGTGRDPYEGRLSDNVGEAFASCNASEIRFIAAKHNVQMAFALCGSNRFAAFDWSPDGKRIYFQLVLSANIMEATRPDKRTSVMPIPAPSGNATWLGDHRLVVPVVGDKEAPDVLRMAVYAVPAPATEAGTATMGQVSLHALPGFASVDQLTPGDDDHVDFVGRTTKGGPGAVYTFDVTTGETAPAFPWLEGPVDTFTYTPEAHAVAIGVGDHVTLYDSATGAVRGAWDDARRGVLHPDGRWLALEYEGAPVSVFHQRNWDEVSDQARKREQARAAAFAERLPDEVQTTVRPPSLSLVDTSSGRRMAVTAFQGDHFAWYPGGPTWGTFFTWGFESKQFKRNVGVVNLAPHLEALATGASRYGMEDFVSPSTGASAPTPAPTDEATPAVPVAEPGAAVPAEEVPVPAEAPHAPAETTPEGASPPP